MRIVSTIVGVLLLVPIFIFSDTILLNLAVMLISAFSVYEAIHIMGFTEQRYMLIPSIIFALITPFAPFFGGSFFLMIMISLYVLYLFCVKLYKIEETDLNHLIIMGFFAVTLPTLFSTLIYTRASEHGLIYMLSIFLGAWATDIFAYVVGKNLGRHKLIPKVSPNKTVEGSIGGIVATVLVFVGGGVYLQMAKGYSVNFGLIVVFAVLASIVAQIGDLSASAIKRDFGAKDFGHLIPGHGGMLDRFDSFLFLAPFIYFASQCITIFR